MPLKALLLTLLALAPYAKAQSFDVLPIQAIKVSWYEEHQESCLNGTCAPEHLTDGDLSIASSLRTEVKAGESPTVTIDLGAAHQIESLLLAFMQTRPRSYTFSLYLRKSDREPWSMHFDQVESKMGHEGFEAFSIKSIEARYLKIVGHGGTHPDFPGWTNICELIVLGRASSG